MTDQSQTNIIYFQNLYIVSKNSGAEQIEVLGTPYHHVIVIDIAFV